MKMEDLIYFAQIKMHVNPHIHMYVYIFLGPLQPYLPSTKLES